VFVPFAPIAFEGRSEEAAILVDWMRWPVRRWTDLDGLTLGDLVDPSVLEPSLYVADEHEPATLEALAFRHAGGADFDVDLALRVDVPRADGSVDRGVRIATRARVAFGGLIVVPESLEPPPRSAAEAAAVARAFLDLADFEPPRWDRFRWHFAPRVDPSQSSGV
jgi:hypothetical protein